MKYTYLGPSEATFSALAYKKFAQLFRLPPMAGNEEMLAETNEQVVPLVAEHGGLGVIAMETEAEGRMDGPINSFVRLIDYSEDTANCPVKVIAAMLMPVSFTLMARPGVQLHDIKTVIAHPKALGACKNNLRLCGIATLSSDSNGKAAQEVARNPAFVQVGALGPLVAAEKYGLKVLAEDWEDQAATTTFFMVGGKAYSLLSQEIRSDTYRSLLVFRVNHEPEALVRVLRPFGDEGLSLRQIHSSYVGAGEYDFVVELEFEKYQIKDHRQAMREATEYMTRHILFGPFPVVWS